jgi:hypothetical protein
MSYLSMKDFAGDVLITWASGDPTDAGEMPSILSNSGLSPRIIDFQLFVWQDGEAPGDGGWEGVYFKTISVHF